jgi:hypothetical protein
MIAVLQWVKKVKERKDDVEARSNYKIDQRLFIAKSICITTNSRSQRNPALS